MLYLKKKMNQKSELLELWCYESESSMQFQPQLQTPLSHLLLLAKRADKREKKN